MDIITLDSWNKNEKISKIRERFLELNKEKRNNTIKIKDLIHLNNFTEYLYNIIDKEKDIEEFDLNLNIGDIFTKGKIMTLNPDEIDLDSSDFDKILPHGICLSSFYY